MESKNIHADIEFTNEDKLLIKVIREDKVIAQEWFNNEFWRSERLFNEFITFVKEYKEINPEEVKLYLEDKYRELTDINDILALIDIKKKEALYKLSKYFLGKYNTITLSDTDEILIYRHGVYIPGSKIIARHTQDILKDKATINTINELLGHIKRETYKDRDEINEPIDKICLKNGILNLNTLEIEQHNHNIFFLSKLPVSYNKEADCPEIKKFLKEVLPESSIPVVQELIGYCLYKKYHIHKAFMLIGTGANGKSTFINLLRSFLGKENCASIPLQRLEENRFSLSSLHGKLTNMFADLPARSLRYTSIFKMLTGEDLIPAEKKFKDEFFFQNHAKQLFSCNQIPESPDESDAFFRRWIIITFPNQYLNNPDRKLLSKLTTDNELSGLLNYALIGLKRLLEKGDFSNPSSTEEVREEYIRKSDSVGSFIKY